MECVFIPTKRRFIRLIGGPMAGVEVEFMSTPNDGMLRFASIDRIDKLHAGPVYKISGDDPHIATHVSGRIPAGCHMTTAIFIDQPAAARKE